MNVLVVDSNPLVRRVVQNCLAPVRYQVLEAADQAAAASLLRHQQIPILLTAWPMPGGDGGDLLQRIRAAPATQYTYVILLADRDDQAALIEGMHAGADDYLVKPLRRGELVARVQALLRRAYPSQNGAEQLQFGPYTFETRPGRLTIDGEQLHSCDDEAY